MSPEQRGPFVCPECGGTTPAVVAMVSTSPAAGPEDPWSHVLQIIECEQCRREIPAHLAERWENQSIEAAQREWREVFCRHRRR